MTGPARHQLRQELGSRNEVLMLLFRSLQPDDGQTEQCTAAELKSLSQGT